MINVSELNCIDESGTPAIAGASFVIHRNDRIAVLSSSQERSTILCHALAGILHRTHPAHRIEGSVVFNDRKIEELDAHVRTESIAYVPPNSDLLISGVKDTVFGEIALSLELTGTGPDIIREKVSRILYRFSIEQLAGRDPDELSGGERHKVALASMLVREPEVLILDNPTMFLDLTGVNNLLAILRSYDGTIILADPNPYIWASLVNRFIVVSGPDIAIIDSPRELIRAIDDGRIHADMPSWGELYISIRNRLHLPADVPVTHSLAALRTIAGALQ